MYGPFHDVQAVVDGPAARALGDLARERWRRASCEAIAPTESAGDPWPEGLDADLRDVEVAIARTEPAFDGTPGVREIERLYRESLARARRYVYIENQYFTCGTISDQLAGSLSRPSGPEVVLVLPRRASGWLEEATMGVGRARVLEHLRAADRYGRLALYYPVVSGGHDVKVHAKVMIMDDTFMRIGSSNLANRSMGVDTESDLAVEALGRADIAAAVAGLRDRLLAEHLGCRSEEVTAEIGRTGSLIGAIEKLRGGERTLVPLHPQVSALAR